MQINFYIYAIAFTCPKIHPGANYTYMYNLHTVCKSAHVNANGALLFTLTSLSSLLPNIFHVSFTSFFISDTQYALLSSFHNTQQ